MYNIYRTYNLINTKPHTIPELIEICDKNEKVWDIYKNGYTIGINQFEKEATTKKGMRYSINSPASFSEYICSSRTSCSFPSHRLVQFSLAQQKQKGMSISELSKSNLPGFSRISFPENQ